MKSFLILLAYLLPFQSFAQENISVLINGREYQCGQSEKPDCEYRCESSYTGKCQNQYVDTRGRVGEFVLTDKNNYCWKYIKEATDFDGRIVCDQARRQLCRTH